MEYEEDNTYESSGILDPEIVCKYSMGYYIPHFLMLGSLIAYYYYLIIKIPSGIKIKYLIEVSQLQPLTAVLFLKFCIIFYLIFKNSHIKQFLGSISFVGLIGICLYYITPNLMIPHDILMLYLKGFMYFFMGLIVYYVLLVKSSRIEVQGKDIIEFYGVFYKRNDPTDLSWVKDKNVDRNPLERIIGTATLKLSLNKEDLKGRTVVNFKKLSYKNALSIQRYLRENAFDSYREQRRVENLQKKRKNQNRENYIGDEEFDAESEDEKNI